MYLLDKLSTVYEFWTRFSDYENNRVSVYYIHTSDFYDGRYFNTINNDNKILGIIHKKLLRYKLKPKMFYQYFTINCSVDVNMENLYTCFYLTDKRDIIVFDNPQQTYSAMTNPEIEMKTIISMDRL